MNKISILYIDNYTDERKDLGLEDKKDFINKIILGDNLDVMKKIKDGEIDLIITSPPYFKQRDYSGVGMGNEETEDAYIENLLKVFKECYRITKKDGVIVFNLGDKYINGTLKLLPYKFAIKVLENFNVDLINQITWVKLNPTPRQDDRKLIQSTEPFFVFAKSKNYYFNKDNFMTHLDLTKSKKTKKSNIGKKYFTLVENSNLNDEQKSKAIKELNSVIEEVKSGKIESFRMKIKDIHALPYGGQKGGRLSQINNNGFTIIRINGKSIKRDIIESPVETIKGNIHPAVYPAYVVEQIIKLLSREGDVILDPFVGSGTTCLVAKKLNRRYIGIDISKEYVEYAINRINNEYIDDNEVIV